MIKMNNFEKDLANVMGSFMEINLDCVEKQNQEIEKLQNNWKELKKWLEENESFDDYCNETTFTSVLDKMQELEQGKDE